MHGNYATLLGLGASGLFISAIVYSLFRENRGWRLHFAWFIPKRVGDKRYRGYLMRRAKPLWGWEYRLPEPHEDPEFKGISGVFGTPNCNTES